VRAFADALEQIPMALAENSGLYALKALTEAKGAQVDKKQPYFGVDCMNTGNSNMKDQKVF
jgi:T-complex protein 1 subunit epsilon